MSTHLQRRHVPYSITTREWPPKEKRPTYSVCRRHIRVALTPNPSRNTTFDIAHGRNGLDVPTKGVAPHPPRSQRHPTQEHLRDRSKVKGKERGKDTPAID